MKKRLLIAVICAATMLSFAITAGTDAFAQDKPTEKEFTIKLKATEWNALVFCLEKSTAPYTLVSEVTGIMAIQVQKQNADSVKTKK